ncbi:conserved hypothetical protein [Alteracholeplasma palmae J233]|uniref:Uncharacterized protein n=1 Tax=Alteracholeplasma palmae (strain ATCC 49389 / J233) TaxID=1318466 RepID=U4KKZ5_ALTPJ|nr:hypothetical protein [Alteracholeplasma palmae]CCV64392.1 conserved hypothetical protein [Alteracholeplasma palmae J233]
MKKPMIKIVYAYENKEDYIIRKEMIDYLNNRIDDILEKLKKNFYLIELPEAIVYTTYDLATNIFSDNRIPAFTRNGVIYIEPLEVYWLNYYEKLFKKKEFITSYYKNSIKEEILTILTHEMTHDSELFVDMPWDSDIWFEEGFCFYMPRKYLLSEAQYEEVVKIEKEKIINSKLKIGDESISMFGADSYDKESNLTLELLYAQAFLTVNQIMSYYKDDLIEPFKLYHEWFNEGMKEPLIRKFKHCFK